MVRRGQRVCLERQGQPGQQEALDCLAPSDQWERRDREEPEENRVSQGSRVRLENLESLEETERRESEERKDQRDLPVQLVPLANRARGGLLGCLEQGVNQDHMAHPVQRVSLVHPEMMENRGIEVLRESKALLEPQDIRVKEDKVEAMEKTANQVFQVELVREGHLDHLDQRDNLEYQALRD